MYSIKEKARYLQDLKSEEYAEVDLCLLKQLDPKNDESLSAIPARRRAGAILYALLDITTVEEIKQSREVLSDHSASETGHTDQDTQNIDNANNSDECNYSEDHSASETEHTDQSTENTCDSDNSEKEQFCSDDSSLHERIEDLEQEQSNLSNEVSDLQDKVVELSEKKNPKKN